MVVTFCGHRDFCATQELENALLGFLEQSVGEGDAQLLFGGYGAFDAFALSCAQTYKKSHPWIRLVFVTPYMTESYQKNHLSSLQAVYDEICYPGIENRPLKYAISYRNYYMVDCSDVMIAYVSHSWGGAYQMYSYAQKKNMVCYNLAECQK